MRVLIIGPEYYNFLPATRSAFQALGWDTELYGYSAPIHPYNLLNKCRYKLSRDKDSLEKKSIAAFQGFILKKAAAFHPDLVFILNGDFLTTDTLDCFRKTSKVAIWMFDSCSRLVGARQHYAHVDALFCFDKADVLAYEKQGIRAFFLPQACDTTLYRPLSGIQKDIDILFVGNMLYSPRRKNLTNAVIGRFPGKVIRFYGWYQPWFKGLGKWIRRPHKHIYKNVNVSSEKANALYNRARVVLNIHQEHQQDGANPRVFEICGAGAYQVCDWNPYVASLFPDNSIGLYHDEDELLSLVEQGLKTDTEERALNAHNLVLSHHTFKNRMEQVLTTLSLNHSE